MGGSISKQLEIRQRLIDEIESDLIGPRKGTTPEERAHEVLPGNRNPKNEYIAGVLFPGNWEVADEEKEKEDDIDANDEDNTDSHVANDKLFNASSFGLTCRLAPETKEIKSVIEYGIYQALKDEKTNRITFQRTPQTETFSIPIQDGSDECKFKNNSNFMIKYTIIKDNDQIILDFYVVNGSEQTSRNSWNDFMFQPKIILESIDNEKCFIHDKTGLKQEYFPVDDQHLEILFKDKISFGKGHLCSLRWDKENIENRCINKIHTTFVPQETNDFIDHVAPCDKLETSIDMVKLGTCKNKNELRLMLEPLIHEYKKWVDATKSEINSSNKFDSNEREIIFHKIKSADLVIKRMNQGIDLLESDENAFDSFKFANMAIAWQQIHGKWARDNAEKGQVEGVDPLEPIYKDQKPKWRLFQIAFILLNLESIANPKSEHRETVDLLWFPTGGGKTEAYLGLVTFVIAYRRLRGKNALGQITTESLGTAVLMRYTLRLLTVQQFQRSATLMCACEKLRIKDKSKWGEVPFQVGLWVGASVTPNSRKEADDQKQKIKNYREQDLTSIKSKNPYVLINCPWCGKKLKYNSGAICGEPEQWRLFCPRNDCLFSKHLEEDQDMSLPVVLVDEDIYSRCPALIIATVDKFAQISWAPKVKAIFGKVTHHCDIHGFYDHAISEKHPTRHPGKPKDCIVTNFTIPPPEMIIQDELHLISGSLGTLSGLYETAVEYLCTSNGIKPKIIASTATTRSAGDQIKKLFNRDDTMIFPPQIATFGETFFTKINHEHEGKTFIGVLATGKSGLTVLSKISAVILRRIRQFEEDKEYDKEDLDPYFSLVTYFNTQRELGGAAMHFKDSVPNLISQIQNNFESHLNPIPETGTKLSVEDSENIDEIKEHTSNKIEKKQKKSLRPYQFYELVTDELTSRKNSGEIPAILRKLNNGILKTDPPDEREYNNGQPIDLLMATNMLSVGVDIPRLGVMIVNGQPKNNSEYIQATGRIGRTNPGLIITLYSYTKPRDLSYYENFKDYHSTYYKNIETVGLTPFTLRARKIGLFGVLVGMIRMAVDGNYSLSGDKDAHNFDQKNPDQIKLLNKIKHALMSRVSSIESDEVSSTDSNITNLLNRWAVEIEKHGENLCYKEPYHPKISQQKTEQNMYLLKNNLASKLQLIQTPISLRNAEQEQNLFYVDSDEDNDE